MDDEWIQAARVEMRDHVRRDIREKVKSGDWWTIVWIDGGDDALPRAILRDVFNDRPGDDDCAIRAIQMSNINDAIVAVLFVRKTSMTTAHLQAVAAGIGGESPERLSKPIIICCELPPGVDEWLAQLVI